MSESVPVATATAAVVPLAIAVVVVSVKFLIQFSGSLPTIVPPFPIVRSYPDYDTDTMKHRLKIKHTPLFHKMGFVRRFRTSFKGGFVEEQCITFKCR